MSDSKLSKLWKTEDWLACWLGFIIIAAGAVAVLTKAFDFSALKFSTWALGEEVKEAPRDPRLGVSCPLPRQPPSV